MPRNGSGVYSLAEPAFVPQTPISSSAVNADFSDIATALTASLARDGQGGMTAVLPLAASGFTYTIDPDTGIYRSAANEQVIKCGGIDVVRITTAGIFDGVSGANLGFVIGVPYLWTLPAAPTGCVFPTGQACTSSYPLYRAMLVAAGSPYGTDGTDPLFVDMRGAVAAGLDSGRGILSGATLGNFLGSQSVVLNASQMPSHTHTGSGTTSAPSNDHSHTGSGTTSGANTDHTHTGSGTTSGQSVNHDHLFNQAANTNASVQSGSGIGVWAGALTLTATTPASVDHSHTYSFTTSGQSINHNHTYSFTTGGQSANHTHTYSFTTSSAGSDQPHGNVQPTICLNWIMRAA